MQSVPKADWLRPALLIVLAVTLLRLLALAFDRTDLFVDETQYWLWGQRLDFGYYSKPPLIGWAIRLVTDLAGSDARFWVRMPGSVLHGVTALILAALAARLGGARAAIWTAALYVTLPFVAVGSVMFSTDTVMAPFFAAAVMRCWRGPVPAPRSWRNMSPSISSWGQGLRCCSCPRGGSAGATSR
jgi:4-amino-4-deoxy-L-arabinose transferase-like glycosyltransferase